MAASLTERLIEGLALCPCCKAPPCQISKPEDGIPDQYIHETLFLCGARIVVTREDDYNVTYGCPYPADDALQVVRSSLIRELDASADRADEGSEGMPS